MTLPIDLRALWASAQGWYASHSERDRRFILGLLVAIVLSLAYVGIVDPIRDYRKGIAEEIAGGQEELDRSMRFLAAKDSLKAEREELRKRLAAAKTRLLPGGTGTLGAAALQERANSIASQTGITVQSTQVMKEETLDPFHKVSVRLTLSGELKPLADFVSGIEYGQQLQVPFVEVSRRGAVAGAKGPRTLSVTVEVSGFVQGVAEKGGGGKAGAVEAKAEGAEGEAAVAEAAEEPSAVEAKPAPTTSTVTSTTRAPTTTAPRPTAPPATLPRPVLPPPALPPPAPPPQVIPPATPPAPLPFQPPITAAPPEAAMPPPAVIPVPPPAMAVPDGGVSGQEPAPQSGEDDGGDNSDEDGE